MTLATDSEETALGGELAQRVLTEMHRVVVGNRQALRTMLAAIVAGGHVLIDDLPGLGKTLIARSFATVLGLESKRVQFTPDLLPADLIGSTVYNANGGVFEYRPGPIVTNLLIADEINRTPPKTQSALLEAMAEGQISVDGVTRPLPTPFLVLATENPLENEGTYALPEAQLDRFAIRLRLGYLDAAEEKTLLRRRLRGADVSARPVLDGALLSRLRGAVDTVSVDDAVLDYIVALIRATRSHPRAEVGASPRAELDLLELSRANALIHGRDFVVPEDVKSLASVTLAHRITLRPDSWVRRIRGESIVEEVLSQVPAPRADPSGSHRRDAGFVAS
ncbi:AAA family ATPase [Nocardia bovistercoris]|uniref:MoxR family ATPase n=1 Tax=Nocardia bovistercoris TaxID=2785916 RepID=A0A931N7A1_9NOCA|nr:MoxR family ATPase [Nocardia bovistercoris]MBH0781567.1 MoxR family ATPase [Nocardia bovistercoris]